MVIFVFGFSANIRGKSAKQREICCFSAQKREGFCTKSIIGLDCQKCREKNNFDTLYSRFYFQELGAVFLC
jgi:hypothetical protein